MALLGLGKTATVVTMSAAIGQKKFSVSPLVPRMASSLVVCFFGFAVLVFVWFSCFVML